MGWLNRRGRRYFYKYVRRNGRVRAVYCGKGPAAELAVLDIEERKAARIKARAEKAEHRRLTESLTRFGEQVDLLSRATLISAGYYQHHRSEWRKRRAVKKKRVLRPPARVAQTSQEGSISLADLIPSANAGDAAARQLLSETLDNNPEIWRRVGDLGKQAEEMLLKRISRENPFLLDCLKRHANDLRAELGDQGPLLERLAVQRVVLCLLELQLTDAEFPGGSTGSLPQARYVQSAKTAAQRRYEDAVRSLILIREKLGYASSRSGKPPLKVVPFRSERTSDGPPASASA